MTSRLHVWHADHALLMSMRMVGKRYHDAISHSCAGSPKLRSELCHADAQRAEIMADASSKSAPASPAASEAPGTPDRTGSPGLSPGVDHASYAHIMCLIQLIRQNQDAYSDSSSPDFLHALYDILLVHFL